jgi:hypothetical protein
VTVSSCNASEISEEAAIALAKRHLQGSALALSSTTVTARKWSTPENDVINKNSKSARDQLILQALAGKTYWLVSFRPAKDQLGGGAAVFVDALTGEILGAVGSR